MGCTEGLARILVFVANFVFLLVGLALLVIGILYKTSLTKYTEVIPDQYQSLQYVPILSIIVGAIVFFIAFLGCCGTLKSSTCMLTWYGAILIVIFLIQVGLGVFAFIQIKDKTTLQSKIVEEINVIFSQYNRYQEVVDLIQQNFQCCGTTGPSFWSTNIPSSCYAAGSSTYFQTGCSSLVSEFVVNSIKTIGIVAVAVSATEIIGAVLALCLSGCIRDRLRQTSYY